MSVIIKWLADLLAFLFGKFLIRSAFGFAVFASFLVMLYASLDAYFTGAEAMLNGLVGEVPDEVYGVWQWFMPANTKAVLLSMVAATLLRFAANLYKSLLDKKYITVLKK